MISLRDVWVSYNGKNVIKGISFHVEEGEIYGIIGPNGSGKTTILRVMLGIIEPNKGEVLINGVNPVKNKPKIASVFETSIGSEFLRLTAKEDLKFYAALYDVDITNERVFEILKTVELDPNKKLYTFSRGMWQKLYIARALVPDFPIVVLDEPWLGLDVELQKKTVELFKNLGKTLVLTAHEMPLIERACDRIMVINDGRKIVEGTVAELFDQIDWKYEVKIVGVATEVDGIKPIKRDHQNIYYVKDLKKFLHNLDMRDVFKIDITPVSLEDVYLTMMMKENMKSNKSS